MRYVEASDEIFLMLREAFPQDQLVRMYLGERFAYDDPKYTEGAEGAPLWAAKQRDMIRVWDGFILFRLSALAVDGRYVAFGVEL